MQIKVSQLLNGPQISDQLAGGNIGIDLSGVGIDGGKPGDTVFFSLYISASADPSESMVYNVIDQLGIYIDKEDNYNGTRSPEEDLADILALGDASKGLSIYNHATEEYDIFFNTTDLTNSEDRYIINKSNLLAFLTKNLTFPVTLKPFGLSDCNIVSIDGKVIEIDETIVANKYQNMFIYNATKNEWATIDYNTTDEIAIFNDVNWDVADVVRIPFIHLPTDGMIATSEENADVFGNVFKLDFKFELPVDYSSNNIKQFKLILTNRN